MSCATFFGVMQLPEVFDGRRCVYDIPCGRRSALLGAVVHDRNSRRDSPQQCRTSALLPSVVRDDVDINRPELVYGTHQRKLPVGCEIAEVENTQGAEGKENSERTAVLALVCRILLAAFAGRVVFAPTR